MRGENGPRKFRAGYLPRRRFDGELPLHCLIQWWQAVPYLRRATGKLARRLFPWTVSAMRHGLAQPSRWRRGMYSSIILAARATTTRLRRRHTRARCCHRFLVAKRKRMVALRNTLLLLYILSVLITWFYGYDVSLPALLPFSRRALLIYLYS